MHSRLTYLLTFILLTMPLTMSTSPGQAQSNGSWSFSIIKSTAQELLVELTVPDFETQPVMHEGVTYQRLNINGWGRWGQPGQPELPFLGKFVGMPWLGNPQISIVEIEEEILTGYRLYPRPEAVLEEIETGADFVEIFTLDEESYRTDTAYPGQLTASTDQGSLREQPLFRLNLYPFQYNPVRQELTVARRMRVLLTFPEARLSGATLQPTAPAFRNILAQTLVNYSALPQSALVETNDLQSRGLNDEAEYVIITHPDFYNAVQELATYRADQGLSVSVVKSTDIYNNFGNGQKNPEAIRSFLENAYQNWSTKPVYALLVGDSDNQAPIADPDNPTEIIGYDPNIDSDYLPTFYAATSSGFFESVGFAPIDTWFTRLTKVGETYDIYPDIIVGRISAQSDSQVTTVIDKIKAYEQTPPSGDWARRAILVADDGHGSDPQEAALFQSDMDFLASHLPASMSSFKMYRYDSTTSVSNEINKGALILAYSGHGNSNGWASWDPGGAIFRKSDIRNLSNGNKLPFLIVANCSNGFFANPDTARVFTEEFLMYSNKGGIAALAPSASSFPTPNELITEELTKALFDENDLILGSAATTARLKAYENRDSNINLILFEIFTYFGDPAVKLNLPARLSLAGQSSQTTVKAGSLIIYQLNYGVSGAEMSRDLTLVNTLPSHITFESASIPPTSINGRVLTWELGDIPAGTRSITIRARVNVDGLTDGQKLSNQARLYDIFDGDKTVKMEVTVVDEDVAPSLAWLISSSPNKVGSPTEFSAGLVEGTGTDVTYAWNFGDGSDSATSELPSITYTYPALGSYQATLTVSNSQGSVSQTVQVTIIPNDNPDAITAPKAGFISSSPDILGQSTTFTNTSDDGGDDIVTYIWDFGDGETSNEKSPLYTYEAVGDYIVWLTIENSKGRDIVSGIVTIDPPGNLKIFLPWLSK